MKLVAVLNILYDVDKKENDLHKFQVIYLTFIVKPYMYL